jgi:hypothetical protein
MTRVRRVRRIAVLVGGLGGAIAVTAGVTWPQESVPSGAASGVVGHGMTGAPRATPHAGAYWAGLTGTEKQAYVSGFLAGALSEQVREIAVAAHRVADSGSVRRALMDSLRASHGVRFPFAPAVYTSQLDDFYWWQDHVAIPIDDALVLINAQLAGGRGGQQDTPVETREDSTRDKQPARGGS